YRRPRENVVETSSNRILEPNRMETPLTEIMNLPLYPLPVMRLQLSAHHPAKIAAHVEAVSAAAEISRVELDAAEIQDGLNPQPRRSLPNARRIKICPERLAGGGDPAREGVESQPAHEF